jgi:hypothetical protein
MRTAEPIALPDDERAYLQTWVHRGHAVARIQTRARMLVQLAAGWRDVAIAGALEVGVGTVANTRQRFLAGGLEEVLHDQRQERRRQALMGEPLAQLIALAGSPAPRGTPTGHCACWRARPSNGASCPVSRRRPSAKRSKKRAQALAAGTGVPPQGCLPRGASPGWARRSARQWRSSATSTRSRRSRPPRSSR